MNGPAGPPNLYKMPPMIGPNMIPDPAAMQYNLININY